MQRSSTIPVQVEIVVGQSSFKKDQDKLVQKSAEEDNVSTETVGDMTPDGDVTKGAFTAEQSQRSEPVLKELVDILICTPGMLPTKT